MPSCALPQLAFPPPKRLCDKSRKKLAKPGLDVFVKRFGVALNSHNKVPILCSLYSLYETVWCERYGAQPISSVFTA